MTQDPTGKANAWKLFAAAGALLLLSYPVLSKLCLAWWTDENYSHGLLIPFVIAYIVWLGRDRLVDGSAHPNTGLGLVVMIASILGLLLGTLGAELFTQRVALVGVLAGTVIFFGGTRVLGRLGLPFVLLLLAIPLPQIIFNKIAFPLQMLASRVAASGLTLVGIPATRDGNVIELVPSGQTAAIGLEVVEACSGIRSLMTLAALALILFYFTREREHVDEPADFIGSHDFWRMIALVSSSVPIAILTNAGRVFITGVLAFFYGEPAVNGLGHDVAGWAVFLAALLLLFAENEIIRRFQRRKWSGENWDLPPTERVAGVVSISGRKLAAFCLLIVTSGVVINWLEHRGEVAVPRHVLSEFPRKIGQWWFVGQERRFDAPTEDVLKASDYLMRDYYSNGQTANLYVGYYDSRRTGATYHSPQNCLPGSGWQMTNGQELHATSPQGRRLRMNVYIVRRANYKAVMTYWYQGRGRAVANEYLDKVYTVVDSMFKRRTDGAMIRVLVPVNGDESAAIESAVDFSAETADQLVPFVPD
jgi:exosortase D (VPLPA-CTERM-specific)